MSYSIVFDGIWVEHFETVVDVYDYKIKRLHYFQSLVNCLAYQSY